MTKNIITIARLFSSLFRPMYYPTVGIIILLTMTYMSMLPWSIKLWVLGLVYLFTVCFPAICIFFYRKSRGWKVHELRHRNKRYVPYLIYLGFYLWCMQLMRGIHMPRFVIAILTVSLCIQGCCILLNMKWKVSMHAAGSGGIIGALMAYSQIFNFNPTWWLCAAILLSGFVMTSRMILRQHSLGQVLGGTGLGILCGFFGVLLT